MTIHYVGHDSLNKGKGQIMKEYWTNVQTILTGRSIVIHRIGRNQHLADSILVCHVCGGTIWLDILALRQ